MPTEAILHQRFVTGSPDSPGTKRSPHKVRSIPPTPVIVMVRYKTNCFMTSTFYSSSRHVPMCSANGPTPEPPSPTCASRPASTSWTVPPRPPPPPTRGVSTPTGRGVSVGGNSVKRTRARPGEGDSLVSPFVVVSGGAAWDDETLQQTLRAGSSVVDPGDTTCYTGTNDPGHPGSRR